MMTTKVSTTDAGLRAGGISRTPMPAGQHAAPATRGHYRHALRKPLLLDGRRETIEVGLAGPALRIVAGGRRFELPLERVSRITVRATVHWRAEALYSCLAHRIPVVFLDGRGDVLGAALPVRCALGTLDELIRGFLELSGWEELYSNWLRSQRMRILRHWRRARDRSGRPLGELEWREAVRQWVHAAVPARSTEDLALEKAAYLGLCVSTIQGLGARTQYPAWNGGVLSLAADLASVLALKAELDRGCLAQALTTHSPVWAAGVEAGLPGQRQLLLELLGRLRANLSEWVEPWP